MNSELENDQVKKISASEKTTIPCGLIMPISGISDSRYTEEHWKKVKDILERAVRNANLEPRLVSDSDPTAIIQNKIVNNLYYDDIVVCDVSSKNPNVMFELGMRLAFDKPVVIVKDDQTNYIFDIGPIQHIVYPISLSFHEIEIFIEKLTNKIKDTYNNKNKTKELSFLNNFGKLEPQHLTSKNIDATEFISNINVSVNSILMSISRLDKEIANISTSMVKSAKERKQLLQKIEENDQRIDALYSYKQHNEEIPF